MSAIQDLERINKNRHEGLGYMTADRITPQLTGDLALWNGTHTMHPFDRFIETAIKEDWDKIVKRAFELENEHYLKTKELAKREAIDILAEK